MLDVYQELLVIAPSKMGRADKHDIPPPTAWVHEAGERVAAQSALLGAGLATSAAASTYLRGLSGDEDFD